jgi:hypothetical protein
MTEEERALIQEETRRVVCAANRTKKGTVLLGARHWDRWMVEQADLQGIRGGNEEQGFIDQYGNFLTRKEAWDVAKRKNQIIRYVANQSNETVDDILWSENLY